MSARSHVLLAAACALVAAAALVTAFGRWRAPDRVGAQALFSDGPFLFTNDTVQAASDIEVVFAGSQGSISSVTVVHPPGCSSHGIVILGGAEVRVIYSTKCINIGETVSITVMTKHTVTVDRVTWTNDGTPIITAPVTNTRTRTPTPTATPTLTGTPTPTPTGPTATATVTPTPTGTPPSATISATPAQTATHTPTSVSVPSGNGDANGDGRTNSIDAAFVLQFNAALIHSLACVPCADADRNGVITSVDAALILQHDAGLIELPSPV